MYLLPGADDTSLGLSPAGLLAQSSPPACSSGVFRFKVTRRVKASELC